MDNVKVTIAPKKKIVFPKYTIISLVLSVVCLITHFIVKSLEKHGTYIYLFKVSSVEIIPISLVVFYVLFISAVSVFFFKNSRYKVLVVLLTIYVYWHYSILWFVMNFNVIGNKYFEYTSPDKEHVIVVDIENSSDLHSDSYSGDVYEKTSFCTMKKVGWFSKPSNCGNHYFVWNEENFEIHFECETDHDHDTIMLEYPITIEYTK